MRDIHQVSFPAVFLGVIITLALLAMLGLFGLAINMHITPSPIPTLFSNISVFFMSLLAIIILSGAFFLAAYLAVYFSHAPELKDGLTHALGTWGIFSLIIACLGLTAIGVLEVRQHFSTINNPYITTDVEITKLRAITSLNLTGRVEHHDTIVKDIIKTKHAVSWIICISTLIGLFLSILAGFVGIQHKGPKRTV